MWRRLKIFLDDMRTIKSLSLAAEAYARRSGESQPGAEHFLLAAIDLPDGSARRAFEKLGANPDALAAAISAQYDAALRSVGLDPGVARLKAGNTAIVGDPPKLFHAKPSGQFLMKTLIDLRKAQKTTPLVGAHVLQVVASMNEGVAARSLRTMGIDQAALLDAAASEAAVGRV